jgi:hypothetical protein
MGGGEVLRGKRGSASDFYVTDGVWIFEPEVVERPNSVNHKPIHHPETIIPGRNLRTSNLQRVNPEFRTLIDQLHTLAVNHRDLSLDPQPWTFPIHNREQHTNKPNLGS